ncbi:c-type cytochrome [Candidatus Magnetomonas plexicatena]|uniref:c-type cytochrome n=1 Tax=Candidatus Magnetomonas plexicatena TaxID=2552947 RepID=UPI001C76C5E6|nr:cytochrome c [Nitrospirales bacterium LBB_01]
MSFVLHLFMMFRFSGREGWPLVGGIYNKEESAINQGVVFGGLVVLVMKGMTLEHREMLYKKFFYVFVLAVLTLVAVPSSYAAESDGKDVYKRYCSPCHGEKGEGNGPVAKALFPKPRDFTQGSYKIKSTSGTLPLDSDILRTIKNGMPGTSMTPWDVLSDAQRNSLLPVLKGFSKYFSQETPDAPAKVTGHFGSSASAIADGKKLYMDKGCWECHGATGKGDGFKADRLKDDWGNPISAYDFTQGDKFKGGSSDEDVFLRFTTGMSGTPMPSYEDSLTAEQRWNLVHYVKSLMKK